MGKGGGKSSARGGGGGGGSRNTPTQAQREAAEKQIDSLRAPKMGSSVRAEFNGYEGVITRVNPGYRTASGSNTMFTVAVYKGSEEIFRTNRRGNNAFSQAKSDMKQYMGLG